MNPAAADIMRAALEKIATGGMASGAAASEARAALDTTAVLDLAEPGTCRNFVALEIDPDEKARIARTLNAWAKEDAKK